MSLMWIVEYTHLKKKTRESETLYSFKSAVNFYDSWSGYKDAVKPELYEVEVIKRKLM